MPKLGLLEDLALYFHYPAHPGRHSAGRLGSAGLIYFSMGAQL